VSAINALRDPSRAAAPGARVLPLRRGPSIDVLPPGDAPEILDAVYRVLEGTGVRFGSASVSDRLRAAGATVDPGTGRVRLPAALVGEALRLVPRELNLAARAPACDVRVVGTDGWLTMGGPRDMAVDLTSDERRPGTLADVVSASRLADAVPQIGLVGPSVSALDVPLRSRGLRELHAQLANSDKHAHVQLSVDAAGAEALVEIARIVAGGEKALRERPLVSASLPVRSPLALDGEGLEAVLNLARAGIPCGFVSAPVMGVSAPATVAGALVTALVEVLAGLVALQLLVPGAPTFAGCRALLVGADGGGPTPGGPHGPLFQMAWVQLARRLGLPVHVGAFATGSKSSDWQAGVEGGLSATAGWMTPPDLLAAAGARDGGRVFSPVAMLLDTELFDLVRQVPLGFDADDEALAYDVIEKVGPGAHFLGEPHTLRHMREAWVSRFMDTNTWEAWEEKGRPQPPEHARERALELLASHEPTPLPPATEERISEVIADRERDHR
jgi:trimethylamine--corrinoid protein Co-methyltransferase